MKKQIQLLGGMMVFIALLTMNTNAFADFVIKGGGTVVVKSGTSLTANTNVKIESGGTLDNSGTVTLNANFSNDGVEDLGTGLYNFSGTVDQFIAGSVESEFQFLTISNTSGVYLAESKIIVNEELQIDGVLDIQNQVLELSQTFLNYTTTTGFSENAMIVADGGGEVQWHYPAGLLTAITDPYFPIGSDNGTRIYSNLDIQFSDGEIGTGGGYVAASVVNEKEPNNNSFDNYLNRYWTITFNNLNSPVYDAAGYYVLSDVVLGAGYVETDIRSALRNGTEWFVFDPVTITGSPETRSVALTGQSLDGNLTGVEFQYLAGLKVYLQGAYNTTLDEMHVLMREEMPLSATEAYSNLGYSGSESVADRADIPATAVDWILVELRDATEADLALPGTAIQTVAGFVLSDGSIVSVDGESALPFKNTLTNNPYFVIIHRNHINAMSAQDGLTKTNSTYIYDFSVATQIYGTDAVVELETGTGVYGLFAGETNTSNIITNADKQAVDDNIDELYHIGDVNLSGIVSNEDKQFVDDNIDSWGKVPK